MTELLLFLQIACLTVNLVLIPAWLALMRIDRAMRELPVLKQRVTRLEKSEFGIDGLPADSA